MGNASKFWVVIGLMALSIMGIVLFRFFPLRTSADVAAWVQAVGSIGAIGAVFVLQARDHRRLAMDAEARRVAAGATLQETLLLIAIPLGLAMEGAEKHSRDADWVTPLVELYERDFAGLLEMLSKIDPAVLPGRRDAVVLMACRKGAVTCLAMLAHIRTALPAQPSVGGFRHWAEMIEREVTYLETVCAHDR